MTRVRITAGAYQRLNEIPLVIRRRFDDVIKRLEAWPAVSGAKPTAWEMERTFPHAQRRLPPDRQACRRGNLECRGWRPQGCLRGLNMAVQMVKIEDQELVILSRKDFEDLMEKAGVLPPLPSADGRGTMDAKAAWGASIAREVVRRRIAAGMTQTELAKRSGVRLETICRLEAGKHIPRQETIIRLDRALGAATKQRRHGAHR